MIRSRQDATSQSTRRAFVPEEPAGAESLTPAVSQPSPISHPSRMLRIHVHKDGNLAGRA
jgi:hypothetical protein